MKLTRTPIPYAKVLIVDDMNTNLDIARAIMKPYGMQVDCVTSGAEAVDLIRTAQTRYNAIFMDHMMPDMDGMETTRIIREEIGSDYARNVPIIALTANTITDDEESLLKKGFQAFLSKPIDVIKMDTALRQWVCNEEPEQAPCNPPSVSATSKPEEKRESGKTAMKLPTWIEGIDWEAGLNRFGGDKNVYLSIVRSYADNTARIIGQIRNVSAETLADYAILVHGIKGSSYSIEAREAGKQAEELESAAKAGHLEFVRQYSPIFIEALEKLLSNIRQDEKNGTAKTVRKVNRSAPDETLLQRMEEAAADFRINAMEEIIDSLERFNYETQAELVIWLREKVDQMEYAAIHERLAQRKQDMREDKK